jgi:FkbM family methyltransferase
MRPHLRKHSPTAARWIGERFLRPGDGVIDVGASDGIYASVWAQTVGPTGLVLAVDPGAYEDRRLGGISWYSAAVGAACGEAAFYVSGEPRRSSLHRANVGHLSNEYVVPMTTIDHLVASTQRIPRLIKVDAQGAEADILKGAVQALTLPIVWVLELWRDGLARAGATVAEVLAPFRAQRYTPATVYGLSVTWAQAEKDANRREGPSSTDILLIPVGV